MIFQNLKFPSLFTLFLFLTFSASAQPYPYTPLIAEAEIYHDQTVIDNYRWLEKDHAPQVEGWVEVQNDLAKEYFSQNRYKKSFHKYFKRLFCLKNNSVISTGKPGRYIISRQSEEERQPVFYLKNRFLLFSQEKPLLDLNTFLDHASLSYLLPSPDGNYCLFGIEERGSEAPIIFLANLNTLEILEVPLRGWAYQSCGWRPDSKGFYYSAYPCGQKQGSEIYLHYLGTPSSRDLKLVFDKEAREWNSRFSVDYTNGVAWLERYGNDLFGERIIEHYSHDLDSERSEAVFLYRENRSQIYKQIFMHDREFLLTNEEAPNLCLKRKNEHQQYDLFIPEQKELIIDAILPFGDREIAVSFLYKGYSVVKIYNFEGKEKERLSLPGKGRVILSEDKGELYLHYSSLSYPETLFRYKSSWFSKSWLEVVEKKRIDGIDEAEYALDLVTYPSTDGSSITMFVAYKKGISLDGTNPLLLESSGSDSSGFYYFSHYLPWLDMGGVVAIPHLRGCSSHYGESWRKEGIGKKKQNAINDFITAAEFLIKAGFSSASRVAVHSPASDGFVAGAAMVQRPDLFKAVAFEASHFDSLHIATLKDGWGLCSWGEYGNPQDPLHFPYLLAFSPYHNLRSGQLYPAAFFYSNLNDWRVDAFHTRKMVASMQAFNPTGCPPVLMYQSDHSGHQAVSYLEQCEKMSSLYGFLVTEIKGLQEEKILKCINKDFSPPNFMEVECDELEERAEIDRIFRGCK